MYFLLELLLGRNWMSYSSQSLNWLWYYFLKMGVSGQNQHRVCKRNFDYIVNFHKGFKWISTFSESYYHWLINYFLMQDDSYLDSYISTIGVDFVRAQNICIHKIHLTLWKELIVWCLKFWQKIRTVEQDGKTIKLQIVSFCSITLMFVLFAFDFILYEHCLTGPESES